VRSAFALGLHRASETKIIFSRADIIVRRNVWRSLFVLDRFLSASLGRPTAISEDDCSLDALLSPNENTSGGNSTNEIDNLDPASAMLDAAVWSCKVIGKILKEVYSRRKISTRLAQGIANNYKSWDRSQHPQLDWREPSTLAVGPPHGIGTLHVKLLYLHSIIILTRPFFVHLFMKTQEARTDGPNHPPPRISARMERFAEACLAASNHTVALVRVAFESNSLPQRNPFIL
jgi:hypothetical protein